MSTCPAIPGPPATASALTAALAALALNVLFFWGLGHSSERLPPARSATVSTLGL